MRRILSTLLLLLPLCPGAAQAALPAPTGVTASTDSCWGVYLSWDALPGATGFALGNGVDTWQTSDLFYRDSTAAVGANSYWVAGIDGDGRGDSATADGSRITTPSPPTGVSASDDSCGVIRITWTAPADVDSYFVFRNGSPVGRVAAPAQFYRDLTSGSGTFSYTVEAWNDCGTSSQSSADNGTRLNDPPAVPAGLVASNDRCDGVQLTWNDVQGEDGYYLYRDGVPIDTLLANASARLDGSAPAGVTLEYRIAAFNTCEPNPTLSAAETGFRNLPAPDPVSGLSATTDRCDGIELSWADVGGEDGYAIERGGVPIDTVGADETTYLDASASPAVGYTYRVGPFNSCSVGGPVYDEQAVGERAAPAPGPPATVTASDTSCSVVRLDWSASADADSYRVYRGDLLVQTVGAGTLFFEDATGQGTYTYGVAAGNSCGWSDSTTADGTVLPGAPSAPVTVTASDDQCGLVRLDWSASADAAKYRIYRDAVLIDSVSSPTLFYEDAVAPGTHIYGVAAGNSCGWSDSTTAQGTVPPAAPDAPATVTASDTSCSIVRLDWTASANAANYRIYRDNVLVQTVGAGALFFEDNPGAGTYTYGVAAGNSCGWSDSTTAGGTVRPPAPGAPGALTASDTSCSIVRLDWGAAARAEGYEIRRNNLVVDSVDAPGTSYEDAPAAGNYLYRVFAFNSCGRSSSVSDPGSVLPGAPDEPGAITASDTSCLFVRLDWQGVADADSYVVSRNSVDIGKVEGATLVYRDTVASGRYGYAVRAMNECGESPAAADSGEVLPAAVPPAGITASVDSCGLVRLDWTGAPADTAWYVYRGNQFLGEVKVPRFRDTAAPPGDHTYWVGSLGPCGRSDSLSAAGTRPPEAPSAPSSFTASNGLCGVVDLAWSAEATADSYYVYREGAKIGATTGTAFQDAPPAGSYLYAVAARNICGLSDTTAATGSSLPAAPPVPVIDEATVDRCDGILLTWSDVAREEGYYVYRDAVPVDTLPAGTVSYLDTVVTDGPDYSYQVAAFNGCAPSPALSAPAVGSRQAPPPAQVSGLTTTVDRCDGIELTWDDVDGEFGYTMERDGQPVDTVAANQLSWLDGGVTPGTIHQYRVGAFNACSAGPVWSVVASGERPPAAPSAPAAVTASDDSCGVVRVEWSLSANATSYRVFRDSVLLDELTSPQSFYRDTGASDGPFLYEVSTLNSCGESARTADSGAVSPPAPAAPTVSATDDRCDGVEVTWNDVEGELGYIIYKNGVTADSVGADETTWFDDEAVPGNPAAYTVAGWNHCTTVPAQSAPDDGAVLYPPPDSVGDLAATADLCDWISISWTDAVGEDAYVIERDGAPLDTIVADRTEYDDVTALPGSSHSYRVGPVNTCSGSAVFGATVNGSRLSGPPAAVTGMTASDSLCGIVRIEWSESAETGSYLVRRNGNLIATLPPDSLGYTDTPQPGNYEYKVIALNDCDSSTAVADSGTRPPDPPAAPDLISVTQTECDGIHLQWTDVNDELGYYVFRDGSPVDTLAPDQVTWVDTGIPPGTAHIYYLWAFNQCSTDPVYSNTRQGFWMVPPEPVTGLAATADNCVGVVLTWNDTDYELGYFIFRNGDEYANVDSNVTTWVDSAAHVTPMTDYTYQVRPFNNCSGGPVADTTTVAGRRPYDPPVLPGSVNATDDQCEVVVITWEAAPHATNYLVYRDGDQINVADANDTSYIDQPQPGTYQYTVVATNSCGSSSPRSDSGSRRSGPSAPAHPTASDDRCDGVLVTWEEAFGAESYTVRRDGSPIASEIHFSVLQYLDSGVPGGAQSVYEVTAVNDCGTATSVPPVIGMRAAGEPQPPNNVTATVDRCDRIDIGWSYNGTTSDLTGFRIAVRDSGSSAVFDSIGTVPVGVNSFTHTPATGAYEYLVSSVNACGLSPEGPGSKAIGIRKGVPGIPAFNANSDSGLCQGETVHLAWDPVEHATSYEIREGGHFYPSTTDTFYNIPADTARTYAFQIRASGDCGASDFSEMYSVGVFSSPSSPSGVTASQDGCGVIRLAWTKTSNSGAWISPEGSADTLYFPAATLFVDSLADGGSATYFVGGYNLCDTLPAVTEVTGFAYPHTVDPPSAVDATDGICDSVIVTWIYESDLDAIRTFRVIRYDGPVGTSIAVVEKGEEYRVVDRPPDGDSHLYEVQAANECAFSAAAGDAGSAARKPGKPVWTTPLVNICEGETFNLQWGALPGADRYRIYQDGAEAGTTTQPSYRAVLYDPGVYDYEVIAENECGAGPASDELMVVVSEDPVDPAGVTLDSSRCDTVVIGWAPQQDSVIVTRSDRIDPVWIGPGNGSVVDFPLKGATYRVRSFNGCSESEGVTVTLGRPKLRPPSPTAVSATNGLCDSVVITWSVPQTEIVIDHLVVTRSRNDTTEVVAGGLDPEARRHVDRVGTGTYEYEVMAANDCGASLGDETSRDTGRFIPLTARGRFLARSDSLACTGSPFTLYWEPVPGALYYRILENDDVAAVVESGRDSTRFTASSTGTISYRVQAFGACGEGEPSDEWFVTATEPPVVPDGFAATDNLCGEVLLTWALPDEPLEGVSVYRDGEAVGFASWPDTQFADGAAAPGEEHQYAVAAASRCGESALSAPVPGYRAAGLPAPILLSPAANAGSLPIPVTMAWRGVDGAVGYRLQVRQADSEEPVVDSMFGADTSIAVSGLELDEPYQWRLAAISACGEGTMSDWRGFGTIASAPAVLASDPANFSIHVPIDAVIRVTFNTPIDPASLGGAVLTAGEETVPGSAALEEGGSTLLFTPDDPLAYGTTYVLLLSGLRDVFERPLGGIAPVTFTTVPGARPVGDVDGDFQRSTSDVAFALGMLLGEIGPDTADGAAADLNGDGRFTVADLVFLGNLIVNEGTVLLPGDAKGEVVDLVAEAEAGGPGAQRLDFHADLPWEIRSAYVEIELPEGAGEVAGVTAADGSDLWHAREGRRLRVLMAGENLSLAFRVELRSRLALRNVVLADAGCSEAAGRRHALVSKTGDALPVVPHGSLLLMQNRPNPFNPVTEIEYFVSADGAVRLRVFDIAGRAVATLVDRPVKAGWHVAAWDGTTAAGGRASSGIYFGRIESGESTLTIRMALIR